MVINGFIPDRGDLIWLDFTPQAGHEQSGKRPALVLSPIEYNKVTGLCVLLPVTSKMKGYPFEVMVKEPGIEGVILSDQIKNLDWRARNARFIARVPDHLLQEAIQLFKTLIE